MIEVRNNGVPLIEQAPKAAITQSMTGLAEALGGDEKVRHAEAAAKKSGLSGLFKLWPAKGG